jgi:hypothetical protein
LSRSAFLSPRAKFCCQQLGQVETLVACGRDLLPRCGRNCSPLAHWFDINVSRNGTLCFLRIEVRTRSGAGGLNSSESRSSSPRRLLTAALRKACDEGLGNFFIWQAGGSLEVLFSEVEAASCCIGELLPRHCHKDVQPNNTALIPSASWHRVPCKPATYRNSKH